LYVRTACRTLNVCLIGALLSTSSAMVAGVVFTVICGIAPRDPLFLCLIRNQEKLKSGIWLSLA